MRRSSMIFAILCLVLAALSAWLIADIAVARIEAQTRQQVVTALAAAGQNWAGAEADGTHLVLTGTAPDEAARFRALEVIGQVIDGARIDDRTEVVSAASLSAPDFVLEIQRHADKAALVGLVPAEGLAGALAASVAAILGQAPETGLLEPVAFPAPDLWTESVDFALQILPKVKQGQLRVTAGRVEVLAIEDSDAGRSRLHRELADMQPGTIVLSLDIRAPLPVVTPFRFSIRLRDGTVSFQHCAAETPAGRARILSAVQRAGAAELPDCLLALGAPSADWPKAIDLAVAGLEELGGGSLQVTDTEILLTAIPGTDPAKLAQIGTDLRASLPIIYALETVLAVTASDPEPYRPLFSASLHSDGSMSLTGAVPDAATRIAIGTFAASLLDNGQVRNRAQIDLKLPDGWSKRVLTGLETLALLHSGSVTISPENIHVEGRGANEDISAEVNDALQAQLRPEQKFSTMVVTDPSLAVVAAAPANTECAAEIAEILTRRQISFAPNSGKIAGESEPVLDDIAIVLKNCVTAGFEIGGHTDSQGGEVLNQALSQARADAVLDSLLAREVLIAHMSARGYGESLPIGDNETEEGRAKNRRIAFKLLEGSDEPD